MTSNRANNDLSRQSAPPVVAAFQQPGYNTAWPISSSTSNTSMKPVHPDFAFSDANIEIQAPDQTFWVHEYHLKKFSTFTTMIREIRNSTDTSSDNRVVISCNNKSLDFYNTFRIIYASVISIPTFDSDTLVSALRIASVYNYPGLRDFAVAGLERISLPAIQRIELSDEFQLPGWEPAAFDELRHRPETISSSEARVLGIDRFAELARVREDNQRQRLLEIVNKLTKSSSSLEREDQAYLNSLSQGPEEAAAQKILLFYRCYKRHRDAPATKIGDKIRKLYVAYKSDLESGSLHPRANTGLRQYKLILLGYMPHVMAYVKGLSFINRREMEKCRPRFRRAPHKHDAQLKMETCTALTVRLQELIEKLRPGSNVLSHLGAFQSRIESVGEIRNTIIGVFGRDVIPVDMEEHYYLGVPPIHSLLTSAT